MNNTEWWTESDRKLIAELDKEEADEQDEEPEDDENCLV